MGRAAGLAISIGFGNALKISVGAPVSSVTVVASITQFGGHGGAGRLLYPVATQFGGHLAFVWGAMRWSDLNAASVITTAATTNITAATTFTIVSFICFFHLLLVFG